MKETLSPNTAPQAEPESTPSDIEQEAIRLRQNHIETVDEHKKDMRKVSHSGHPPRTATQMYGNYFSAIGSWVGEKRAVRAARKHYEEHTAEYHTHAQAEMERDLKAKELGEFASTAAEIQNLPETKDPTDV